MVPNLGLLGRIGRLAVTKAPTIFTGLSVAGVVTTVGMSIDATIKSMRLIEKERDLRAKDAMVEGYPEPIPMTNKDIAKLIWVEYLPTAAVGLGTILCIIGVNKIHMRRNAALVGLYELADTSLREYRAKVVERLGANKEMAIRDQIAQDHISENPVNHDTVIVTSCGNTLCLDPFSGRYFKSDVQKILKAQNEFNNRLLKDMVRPMNEFYDEIGLKPIKAGDDLGWAWEYGLMEIRFSSGLTEEKEPCLVLEYKNGPRAI
jgi:Family of unknown function (DUF6353)